MKLANNPMPMMELLYERAISVQGNILEIGTWRGGSALVFMEAMQESGSEGMLVTVDPWGGRPYPRSGSRYSDADQKASILTLAQEATDRDIKWHHFKMTSLEFLKYAEGGACWYQSFKMPYQWELAFLDGEHIFDTVSQEIEYLIPSMLPGGTILIDNANHQQSGGANMQLLIAELALDKGLARNFYDCGHGDVVAELTMPGGTDV